MVKCGKVSCNSPPRPKAFCCAGGMSALIVGRGAGSEVLAGGVGADGLGNGDKAGGAGLRFEDRGGGGAIGLAGVEKDGAGDGGDARVNAERGRGLKGRLDGGELRVAGSATAIVEQRSAAEPARVSALDGLELLLGKIARAGRSGLALNANPGTAKRRKILLLKFFVGGAGAGCGFGLRLGFGGRGGGWRVLGCSADGRVAESLRGLRGLGRGLGSGFARVLVTLAVRLDCQDGRDFGCGFGGWANGHGRLVGGRSGRRSWRLLLLRCGVSAGSRVLRGGRVLRNGADAVIRVGSGVSRGSGRSSGRRRARLRGRGVRRSGCGGWSSGRRGGHAGLRGRCVGARGRRHGVGNGVNERGGALRGLTFGLCGETGLSLRGEKVHGLRADAEIVLW